MPACPPEINSTADLKALQRLMSSALFRPLDADDGMAATTPEGGSMVDFAESFMLPNDRLSAFDRLEIYARQYWFRLLDCLYDDYPGLKALLGQKKFHELSIAYLTKYQSSSFTLRNLGRRLEQFLREEPKHAGAKQAMAIDVARFEWAQTLAFDEAQKEPLEGEALLGSDPASLKLGLQPYLVLLDLDHEVDTFFIAVRKNEAGMRSETSNAILEATKRTKTKRVALPKAGKLWLAVHRHENQIYIKRLEEEAFILLAALREGETVGSALDLALANADPTVDWAGKIREWFETWGLLGWFCK